MSKRMVVVLVAVAMALILITPPRMHNDPSNDS